jgi:hypothetical protein
LRHRGGGRLAANRCKLAANRCKLAANRCKRYPRVVGQRERVLGAAAGRGWDADKARLRRRDRGAQGSDRNERGANMVRRGRGGTGGGVLVPEQGRRVAGGGRGAGARPVGRYSYIFIINRKISEQQDFFF